MTRAGGDPRSKERYPDASGGLTVLLSLLLLLPACSNSKVPADALLFNVAVTGIGPDSCHPGDTTGYVENFQYAVAFTGSDADVYVDGEPFAAGVINGCNLTYQTVVIGENVDAGTIKWQLTGVALLDPGNDTCVPGEGDWAGTETFIVVDAEVDETVDTTTTGCSYPMSTAGSFVASGG